MRWRQPRSDLVRMEWSIQDRENDMKAVLLEGQDITFDCAVVSTTHPPCNIVWKVDGRRTYDHEEQMVEIDGWERHLSGRFKLTNISKEMDGMGITCAYSKLRYADSIESILRVFSLNIEAPNENACVECKGNVKLVFKESIQKSPAESNVDKKIKEKIKALTKVNDITVDTSGYSVLAPANEIFKNPYISSMSPTITVGGKKVTNCECGLRN